MSSRRGDLAYVFVIALALGLAWLGTRLFEPDDSRGLDEDRLAGLMREIELPPIDLSELPFGFFRPEPRFQPRRAQPRYADEMELALVRNRNQLLATDRTLPN
jgi:hypothetical protein